MKIVGSILIGLFGCVGASMKAMKGGWHQMADIKADSEMGNAILSRARKLDQNQYNYNNYNQNGENDEDSYAWIAGYSLKFQGCHHISQWNDDAEDEDAVRIRTKRLARFRMCPSDYCSSDDDQGCSEGYGDYVIDIYTYLYYYFEAMNTYQEFQCEYLQNYVCGCNDNNGNGDYCLYDCYADHNMAGICMDNNPYEQDGGDYQNYNQEMQLDLQDYMECTESDVQDQNGNGLYIGPYCASQGGAVYLGVFDDDSCTNFADDDGGATTFQYASGMTLPYAEANIVNMDCLSCKEPNENNYAGNDQWDEDDVAEVCEQIYEIAGKCEANLPYGTSAYPNNNACNYMEGIKIVRKDGTVVTADARANKTASIFIGVFVVAFILLSAYVYYLKTKLDRASINLAE